MKTGVIHGRFQGLHNGHMEYLLTAKKRCDFLVIGITNFLGNAVDSEISRIESTAFPRKFEKREILFHFMKDLK